MVGQWCIIEAFVLMQYCFTGRSIDCQLEAGGRGVGLKWVCVCVCVCVCADVDFL